MNPSDIAYVAQLCHSLGRFDESVEFISQLAQSKPVFERDERQLFGLVFKSAIDPVRQTLRTLSEYKSNITNPKHMEAFELSYQSSFEKLESLCKVCHHLVSDILLPASDSPHNIACFEKLRGDLFRYILEFANFEQIDELTQQATKAYSRALDIANANLPNADPLKLGVVLNFAVFKYEYLKEIENAKEMVQNAIKEYQSDSEKLTPASQKEAINVIGVMQSNLISWSEASLEEESEEDTE